MLTLCRNCREFYVEKEACLNCGFSGFQRKGIKAVQTISRLPGLSIVTAFLFQLMVWRWLKLGIKLGLAALLCYAAGRSLMLLTDYLPDLSPLLLLLYPLLAVTYFFAGLSILTTVFACAAMLLQLGQRLKPEAARKTIHGTENIKSWTKEIERKISFLRRQKDELINGRNSPFLNEEEQASVKTGLTHLANEELRLEAKLEAFNILKLQNEAEYQIREIGENGEDKLSLIEKARDLRRQIKDKENAAMLDKTLTKLIETKRQAERQKYLDLLNNLRLEADDEYENAPKEERELMIGAIRLELTESGARTVTTEMFERERLKLEMLKLLEK